RQPPQAHIEDERAREPRQRLPVERGVLLRRVLVPGHEGDRGGVLAVGHRDARIGGSRHAGGHPGYDLERYSGRREGLGLLTPAPAAITRSAGASPRAAGWLGSPRTRSRTHSEPSGSPAKPTTSSSPSSRAHTPTGVMQVASSAPTTARSAVSSTRASWSEIRA